MKFIFIIEKKSKTILNNKYHIIYNKLYFLIQNKLTYLNIVISFLNTMLTKNMFSLCY